MIMCSPFAPVPHSTRDGHAGRVPGCLKGRCCSRAMRVQRGAGSPALILEISAASSLDARAQAATCYMATPNRTVRHGGQEPRHRHRRPAMSSHLQPRPGRGPDGASAGSIWRGCSAGHLRPFGRVDAGRASLAVSGEFRADELGASYQRLDLPLGHDVLQPGERAVGVDAHPLWRDHLQHLPDPVRDPLG